MLREFPSPSLLPAALLLALISGCSVGGAPEGVIDQCSSEVSLPPGVATDILFVIDNSESMQEEQAKVMAELETFVSVLLEGPVTNDFQVGVVTTAVTSHVQYCLSEDPPELRRHEAESGKLQPGKDEKGQPTDGPRILRWDDPDFLPSFRSLVSQGIKGSGQEMGLEAMRLAISKPLSNGGNKGFLRPGARLLVVIVSDEDDCSDPSGSALVLGPPCETIACETDDECGAEGLYCLLDRSAARSCQPNACETAEGRAKLEPVERYVDFLRGLDDGTGKGRKRETFLAVIGAVGEDDERSPERCASNSDEAQGVAVRYREAVEAMGEAGYIDSICSPSYGTALREIARLVNAPHVLELAQNPLDGRLVQVEITRESGERKRCRVDDGFRFEEATPTSKARIVLDDECRLRHGDRVQIELICAG